MSSGFVVLFALALIAMVAIGVFSYLAKKRRLESFALVASRQGLSFAEEDPFATLSEPFVLLNRGDGQGVENVLWGVWQGTDLRAFDYWYYQESRNAQGHTSRTYYRFDCVRLGVTAHCPPTSIDPENLFTRLADALSFHDIEFESEVFNRAFTVRSVEEKFANDLVDARMIEWLLANATDCWIEFVDDQILVARKRLAPEELPGLMGLAVAFVAQVPRVVGELYPGGGSPRPNR
ncbi:MAG: hypothetical protein ACXWDR_02395 [Actinomycetota bacterium]